MEAELKLFEAALSARAPNGCAPQWVQLISSSSLPLNSCAAIHEHLAALPPVSRLAVRECEPFECTCATRRPAGWRQPGHFLKASQWALLHVTDARKLVATRHKMVRAALGTPV